MISLENAEFELRTDHNITDDGIAQLSEIKTLQNVTEDGLTGDGCTVVVMDSGIDVDHPVFDDTEVVERVDVTGSGPGDEVGHGTAVAGTIARLAPDVEIISLRIFGSSGRTSGDVIFDAYKWLIDNSDRIDIVNMSWGAQQKVNQIDVKHNQLVDAGVHTVVAAGNTGEKGGSPSTAKRAFSAGAVDVRGKLTRFSSYNPNYDNPDVCGVGKNNRLPRASGTDMGTVLDGRWVKASGTSFSAPVVAGLYARVLEKRDLSVSDAVGTFEKHANDIPDTPEDGAGIADYRETIEGDLGDPVKPDPTATANAWSFLGNDTVYFGADWLKGGTYTLTLLEDDDDRKIISFEPKK